jgi:hypothetical protein
MLRRLRLTLRDFWSERSEGLGTEEALEYRVIKEGINEVGDTVAEEAPRQSIMFGSEKLLRTWLCSWR